MLVGFFVLSCENENIIELSGTWYITQMMHQGKPTYPKTTNKSIRTILENEEDVESLSFRIVDSTLVLPGFYSQKVYTTFSVSKSQLTIQPNFEDQDSELTNLIFGDTYEMSYSKSDNTLELESKDTYLLLIHRDEVMSKNLEGLFE